LLMGPVIGTSGCEAERTTEQACRDGVALLCGRRHRCLDQGQLATRGWPPTEAACIEAEERARGCPGATAATYCGAGAVYRGEYVEACLAELEEASCGQLDAPDLGAPACGEICGAEGGRGPEGPDGPASHHGDGARGRFALSWSFDDLHDEPVSCDRAGVDEVEVALAAEARSASADGGGGAWSERFRCTDAVGITMPHPLGFYRIAIRLLDDCGSAIDHTEGTWELAGEQVDLGHFAWRVH